MKLNYKRTFFIGLAFLSICSFWQLYDNIIPLILRDTFGLGDSIIGVVMAMDNVLALFLLPFFGALSDRTLTRLGRRTPFILSGTLMAVITMLMLPLADNLMSLPFFIVALALVLLAMGTYRSPAVALMPDLTPKPLRSKANAVINLMGALGGVFTLVAIKLLVPKVERPGYLPLFIAIAALMIVSVLALLAAIPEKKLAEENASEGSGGEETLESIAAEKAGKLDPAVRRSLILILMSVFLWYAAYNAVTTAFSRYATTVWGMTGGDFSTPLLVGTVAATLSYIPIGIISSQIGRKKMIQLGIIVMTACYILGILFVSYSPLIYVVFVGVGFGWAAINVNSYPMVVEMSKSGDVGKYTGIYYIFSMTSQVVTPILSGLLLEHVSYRTLFPYATVFSLAAFFTMSAVMHGDVTAPKKEALLEHFDVDD